MSEVELVPFLIQVLARCEAFHAVLDLPDTDPANYGPNAYYLVTLKACEVQLLQSRHFAFYDDVDVDAATQETPGRFGLDVKVRLLQRDGVAREIVPRKHSSDISRLHNILRELHPDIQKLQVPRAYNRGDVAALAQEYFRNIVEHSKFTFAACDGDNLYMHSYLRALQATEVSEQLAAFLDSNLLRRALVTLGQSTAL